METEKLPVPSAAAAPCPGWVLLNYYGCRRDSLVAKAKDAVASCTSTGRRFHASFLLAPPPASSSCYYSWAGEGWQGSDGDLAEPLKVITAHGDSVLLEMKAPRNHWQEQHHTSVTSDYFLYDAGNGATRPPSLSLLPGCYFPMLFERGDFDHGRRSRPRRMDKAGVLRHGEGELLVVELKVPHDKDKPRDTAELCVLHLGDDDWELNRAVPIVNVNDDLAVGKAMWRWETDTAVPIGDRFLRFVDYLRGFLLCDMAAEGLDFKLRYVPLPVDPDDGPFFDGRPYMSYSRNVGAAGAAAVRFVCVEPQCCCGSRGRSTCAGGRFLFTVTTWTLSLKSVDDGGEPMVWVKDGVLDCEELWTMPRYKGLPELMVESPMVSSGDPDLVFFVLCKRDYKKFSDRRVWILKVDVKRKELRSVAPYKGAQPEHLVQAKLGC